MIFYGEGYINVMWWLYSGMGTSMEFEVCMGMNSRRSGNGA